MRYDEDNVIKDFARRTQHNLAAIDRLQESGHAVYEATQLINSMLGLLIFPKEEYFKAIPETPIKELEAQGWPVPKVTGNFEQVSDLRQLIRYLRNAVAHFNMAFPNDGTNQLRQLLVWNTDQRTNNRTWAAELTLEDLRALTHRFVEHILAEA